MREQLRYAPAALLGLTLSLGALELGLAANSYRTRIADTDFESLNQALADLPPGRLRLGSPWLDARLRRHLSAEQRLGLVAPDEQGSGVLAVVVAAGEEPTGLELPPTTSSRERFGGLELIRFERAGPSLQVDLVDSDALQVFADDSKCSLERRKSAGRRWNCRPGKLYTSVVEVGYQARRCIVGEALQGQRVRFELGPRRATGDSLYGHIGFGDFNARLRSDALADVRVLQGDRTLAHFTVADDQGWRAFRIPLDARHGLSIEVSISDDGSFDAGGEARSRPPHRLCFEARLFGGTPP